MSYIMVDEERVLRMGAGARGSGKAHVVSVTQIVRFVDGGC